MGATVDHAGRLLDCAAYKLDHAGRLLDCAAYKLGDHESYIGLNEQDTHPRVVARQPTSSITSRCWRA